MKQITKKEFDKFIEEYPNKLNYHIVMHVDPPIKNYFDETLNEKYPENIVAQIHMDYMDNDGNILKVNDESFYEYFIKNENRSNKN